MSMHRERTPHHALGGDSGRCPTLSRFFHPELDCRLPVRGPPALLPKPSLPVQRAALRPIARRATAHQIGPLTPPASTPRTDVVQRVPRLPAVRTTGSPATENPLSELPLGLTLGKETGPINLMVNHALQGGFLSLQSAPKHAGAQFRYHPQYAVTKPKTALPSAQNSYHFRRRYA
jgi:hypothetical protein